MKTLNVYVVRLKDKSRYLRKNISRYGLPSLNLSLSEEFAERFNTVDQAKDASLIYISCQSKLILSDLEIVAVEIVFNEKEIIPALPDNYTLYNYDLALEHISKEKAKQLLKSLFKADAKSFDLEEEVDPYDRDAIVTVLTNIKW